MDKPLARLKKVYMEPGQTRNVEGFVIGPDIRILLGVRTLILLIGVPFLAYAHEVLTPTVVSALVLVICLIGVVTAVGWISLANTNKSRHFQKRQIVADLLLVTLLVYGSGGSSSPFLVLYPLLIMMVATRSRRQALILGFVTGLGYWVLAQSLLLHKIPTLFVSQAISAPVGGLFMQILGLVSAMILIAVWTSHLSRRGKIFFEESKKNYRDAQERQRNLTNQLPYPVFTVDIHDVVTHVNRVAIELLGEIGNTASGRKFFDVLKEYSKHNFSSEEIVDHEVELLLASDSSKFVLRKCDLSGPEGILLGKLYILQDVTELRSVEEQLRLQERMARLLSDEEEDDGHWVKAPELRDLVGESPVMRQVFKLIERVSHSEATILISGESGTGKELVAKAIHNGSARSNRAFVPVNCGAIPENLIESELFGYKKGSFTGASSDYTGLFQQADGGTLFLDEIGELPLHLQVKILRTLQERLVRPIGGAKDIPIDVRIIAATNKNLRKEVQEDRFREDLYYRLNVINISLPSLKDRREDLPVLTHSILKRLVDDEKIPVVSPEAMQCLLAYDYPGNVRELENILERAVVLGGEVVLKEHLPEQVCHTNQIGNHPETRIFIDENLDMSFPVNLDDILQSIERRYLEAALAKTHGMKKKAADLLGINFRSFRYRLQKFGMQDEERRGE